MDEKKTDNKKNIFWNIRVPDIIIKISIALLILSSIYIIINLFNNIINSKDKTPYDIIYIFIFDAKQIVFSLTFWGIGIIFKKILEQEKNEK